jgi:hypothetical protein
MDPHGESYSDLSPLSVGERDGQRGVLDVTRGPKLHYDTRRRVFQVDASS